MSLDTAALDALETKYKDDEGVQALIAWHRKAEPLLQRALYEFGSELRLEIESLLGVEPLLPHTR